MRAEARSPVSERIPLSGASALLLAIQSLPREIQACWWPGKQFCAEWGSSLLTPSWREIEMLEEKQVGEVER